MNVWAAMLLASATGVVASGGAGLLPAADLVRAETLERRKCYRCHKPYDPRDYSVEEWGLWMDKMSRKVRLKAGEDDLLRR